MRLLVTLLSAGLVFVALAGCGGDSSGDPAAGAAPETVTVEKTVSAADGTTPGAPKQSDKADPGGDITVPDVVGKDHQLAQDTMQAAGLYNLAEEDATGQDRLLLLDRNWVVVDQDPPGGSKVGEDATIVLRSKKDGE